MSVKRLFTSESVTEGHPDKLCDQVSDGILDAVLAQDPGAHVACATITTTGAPSRCRRTHLLLRLSCWIKKVEIVIELYVC